MTVQMVDDPTRSVPAQRQRPRQASPNVPAPRRRLLGVRVGQVVATQVALALVVATLDRPAPVILAAGLIAVALLLVTWVRLRRRWLFEWVSIWLRHASRRHGLGPDAGAGDLLDLLLPGAVVDAAELGGDAAAVISDGYGLTAVLELGEQAGVLNDAPHLLPTPAGLLPAPSSELPPVRIQLVLAGAPAPVTGAGGATPATSYRQLTDGRLLGHERALLAIRVLRVEGWSDADLRRALSSTVRKVRRRLAPVPARVLGEQAALRVLAEAAHHDGAEPVTESWTGLRAGGLTQTTFRLGRWPDLRGESGRRLLPRLLALPAAVTTVALSAGPWRGTRTDEVPVELNVRLAADDPAGMSVAVQALRRLLAAENVTAWRLDGEQLNGFATTLPLGVRGGGLGSPAPANPLPVDTVEALELPLGSAGLMLGTNRHGEPVTARLFRAEATRITLIGGVRPAQLIALRAMALGARVVVQTSRPRTWEPFVRGVSAPGGTIPVVPPGRPVTGIAGTPLHPLLVIVDVGPVGADPQPGPGWHTTLVVRDELTAADTAVVSRADLVILQPLLPAEAALAGTALGLGEAATWLTRIRPDMVALVNRRALRWALLTTTPIEGQLVGSPQRG